MASSQNVDRAIKSLVWTGHGFQGDWADLKVIARWSRLRSKKKRHIIKRLKKIFEAAVLSLIEKQSYV